MRQVVMTRWHRGWTIVAAVIVFQAICVGMILYGVTFWIDPWMREFGASRADLLVAPVCLTVSYGMLLSFVGQVLDRVSIRLLICAGAVLQGVGYVLIGLATAVWQIVVVYGTLFAGGVALTGSLVSQTLATRWFKTRRGLAIGLVSTGSSVGALLLPHLIAELLEELGWRNAHLTLGGLVVLSVVPAAWVIIRNTPQAAGAQIAVGSVPADAADHDIPWTVRKVLSQRVFWVLGIALLILTMVVAAIPPNLAPLAQDLDIQTRQVPMLFSIYACALIPSSVSFGYFADGWDSRCIYWSSATALAVALVMMLNDPDYQMLMVASLLLGCAEGCIMPLLGTVFIRHFGISGFGRAAGLLLFPLTALSMTGAMIMGGTRDYTGSYDTGLTAGLLSLIPAVVLVAWLPTGMTSPSKATK